jgi:hypothetical protein
VLSPSDVRAYGQSQLAGADFPVARCVQRA